MADEPVTSTLEALFRACEHARNDLTPFFPLADCLREQGYDDAADLIELYVADPFSLFRGCPQFMFSCGELLTTVERMAADGCLDCRAWASGKLALRASYNRYVASDKVWWSGRLYACLFRGCVFVRPF